MSELSEAANRDAARLRATRAERVAAADGASKDIWGTKTELDCIKRIGTTIIFDNMDFSEKLAHIVVLLARIEAKMPEKKE